jgi:gamma-glutamyltranspeptidase/glutathione hydrolase
MSAYLRLLVLLCGAAPVLGLLALPTEVAPADSPNDHVVCCHNGLVVSVSDPASDVGVSILQEGGNAVDAAVATAFALAVAYPPAGNLGGGGFMLVHPAPGEGAPTAFDYREVAPAAAWRTMFAPGETQFSPKAVAVPGTVRGMGLAHQRFGTLPWSRLLQPAIRLAQNGFVLDANLADSLNLTLGLAKEHAEFQRVFGKPGGGPWRVGDRLVQPNLAGTLQVLADQGPDAFYHGPIAAAIVAEMARGQGLITAADLAGYCAVERPPLTTRYRGVYDVYVPSPPSSGGVCLLEVLNILDNFDLKYWGRWSAPTLHVMAEAMRRATCDRARYLGDPAFVEIPAKLTAPAYGRQLAATIDLRAATRSDSLAKDIPLVREGDSTTHFSIIDNRGMAVANTYTLERRWGSRVVVKDMGFLLNNDMMAFNLFPGATNRHGQVGTEPNTIAPNKRMLTSMTPTIVTQGGHVKVITGSPGSRAIPYTVASILVSVLDFEMPVEEAVAAPRLSQEWFPDHLSFEAPDRFPETIRALRAMGHTIVAARQGDAHTIWVRGPNDYVGVADRRINGKASGY